MQQFLDNSTGASRLSVFNFFMAPMQAFGLMVSSPKFFFSTLSCALGIIISLFVYVGGIFVIPGIISLITAMTVSVVYHGTPNLGQNLATANFHYRLKIYCYNALALLPLISIITSGTNLYYNFVDGKLTSGTPIYWLLAAFFFTLTFGVVITAAVTLSMRRNSGILASCADAIELLWKNPAGIFALWINWFLELFIFYFLVLSAMLVLRLVGASWPVLITSSVSIIMTVLLTMVFLAHYLVTASLITIEVFSKAKDAETKEEVAEDLSEPKNDAPIDNSAKE